jgi:glyoxylase-like metal-dependent hydrolase (beta-lactamase superfamily II)
MNVTRVTPEQAPHAQLRARGVDPGDVRLVVITHLHWDHAASVKDFPAATYLVTDAEWRGAHRAAHVLGGYNPGQFEPASDWRTITHVRTGGDPFASPLDLFGDGSVQLVSTPGHSPGHQSLLLRTSAGPVLLTGDAVYDIAHMDDREQVPLFYDDAQRMLGSRAAIDDFVRRTPGVVVIPGHDPVTWPEIAEVYG